MSSVREPGLTNRQPQGFGILQIQGSPTREEEAAILEALRSLRAEAPDQSPGTAAPMGTWTLAGRLEARRGGILDARSLLGAGSWPATAQIPWSGRAYDGRRGRGDSR